LRQRDAALAGALSAISLAIGLEMAPAIAALAAAMALRWIVAGEPTRPSTVTFAVAFAAMTAVAFVATVPPRSHGVAACDMLSLAHVAAAGIGGCGLAVLAAVCGPRRSLWSRKPAPDPCLDALSTAKRNFSSPENAVVSAWIRLAGAGALAAVLAATLYLAFPDCLRDPFADLDPRFRTLWLANVTEVRSIASMMRDLPQEVLPYYGLPAAALALGVIRLVREPVAARWRWVIALAVLATLFIAALWLVRAAAAANAITVALFPAALVRMLPVSDGRAVCLGLGRAALLAAALLNPLTLIAMGGVTARAVEIGSGAPHPPIVSDGPGACHDVADYAPLARFPRGLVLGFIDAGPFLLMQTPHAVLAAPYHRNIKGNAAAFDVFLAPASEAEMRLAALGVDYVAFCAGAAERHIYAAAAPDGLAAALARGDVSEFLERIPLDGTALAVYRARH
jgi:hypothetical protein